MSPPLQLPRVTVVIATFNRPALLAQTLETVLAQDYPADLFQVWVVDNNSPPATRAVVESFRDRTPAPRWILETTQGVSHARNRAIREATTEIIAFADDDILAEKDWLRKLMLPFVQNTGKPIGAVGGTVLPVYPDGCPPWWRYTHPLKLTEQPAPLPVGEERKLMGASLAITAAALKQVGGFRVDLGRTGTRLLDAEEPELLERIRRAGYEIWFASDAVVQHQMVRSRLTWQWACRNAYDSARTRVIWRLRDQESGRAWPLYYLISRLILNAVAAPFWLLCGALVAVVGQRGLTVHFLVRACRSWGFVRQMIVMAVSRPKRGGRTT